MSIQYVNCFFNIKQLGNRFTLSVVLLLLIYCLMFVFNVVCRGSVSVFVLVCINLCLF